MWGSIVALLVLAAAGQSAPHLSRDSALQLFAAAGFPFRDGRLVNVCGQPANPQVRFADLNGDGVLEAQVVDVAPDCYAKPGAHYAVLARTDDGPWRVLAAEDAVASFPGTRTAGWNDIEVKPGNGACPGVRHFAGDHYASACAAPTPVSAPAAPAATAGDTPPDQQPDDPAADQRSVAALTTADRTAIFQAAGAKRIGAGRWRLCTDDAHDPAAAIAWARDINGDGRPEAIVTESGLECYGNTAQGYALVSKQSDGRWTRMLSDTGIPMLMTARGVGGYPDIINGGPGMCFAVERWDGRKYDLHGGNDGDGHACRFP